MRWSPILAVLGIMLLVPSALGHHCTTTTGGPGGPQAGDGFNVQSTTPPTVPVPLIVGLLLIPVVIVGLIAAAVRGSARPSSGRWVWTPEAWVFVRDEK